MQKHIKNFNDFENSINEGLVSWASKKFKQGELDELISKIFNNIKNNFKISKLEYKNIREEREFFYIYEINDDIIKVSKNRIILNNEIGRAHV